MYADCFLIPIRKTQIARYKRLAGQARKAWMRYGALDYKECMGDALNVPGVASFAELLKLKKGETCIFAWITYKSKAHAKAVNAKVMADPSMLKKPDPMPFDDKKMRYGGFKVIVGA
jgi:uncharacterized protein YbaA (DUF1428 family)